MIDAAFTLRVRIPFEDVLLELLEKQRIIVIILLKRLTSVHGILPGLKCLCRSLLRATQNPQFLPDAIDKSLAAHAYSGRSCRAHRGHVIPGIRAAIAHHDRFAYPGRGVSENLLSIEGRICGGKWRIGRSRFRSRREIYEDKVCVLFPPAPNLLTPESRENRVYAFVILWEMICEVGDGSFDRLFHNFCGKACVSKHRPGSSLHIWPM
jgi:hypothetical protein